MGRRKTFLYGRAFEEKYQTALGFPEFERAGEVLSEIDFDPPKIDWSMIEANVDHEIPQYSRKKLILLLTQNWVFGCEKRSLVV